MAESKNKCKLLITNASCEAAEYAVKHWHYSKILPVGKKVIYGVWENNKFIGVVIFSRGASPHLWKRYNMQQTEGCEMTRVALNNHITPVTKIISICLKKLKKDCPGLKVVVSFADPEEGHLGIIYQAGNWIYTGCSDKSFCHKIGNKIYHHRTFSEIRKKIPPHKVINILKEGKYRYFYPLTKEVKEYFIKLAKPYPKSLSNTNTGNKYHTCPGGVIGNISGVQSEAAGSSPCSGLSSSSR